MTQFKIGFANLNEVDQAPIVLRESLERAAARHKNVQLILRDNQLSTRKVRENIQEFVDIPVDLTILFHLDERAMPVLLTPLFRKSIPVITIGVQVPMTYFFGIDDAQAGRIVGNELKKWVENNWDGQIDKMLILTPQTGLSFNRKRIDAAMAVLQTMPGYDKNSVLYVDEGGTPEMAVQRATQALVGWEQFHRIVILSIIDYIAVPVLQAIRAAGREGDVAVGSFDGTPVSLAEFQRPSSRLIVAPTAEHGKLGSYLLDMALRILNKESVPGVFLAPVKSRTREDFARADASDDQVASVG